MGSLRMPVIKGETIQRAMLMSCLLISPSPISAPYPTIRRWDKKTQVSEWI
jgi:hypothetical protein